MTGVLIRRGNLDTMTEMLGKCHIKWSYAVTSQRRPPITSKPPGTRRHGIEPSLRALKRNQPCRHLDFGLPASRTETVHFRYSSHRVCGTSLWPPQETSRSRWAIASHPTVSLWHLAHSLGFLVRLHTVGMCCQCILKMTRFPVVWLLKTSTYKA